MHALAPQAIVVNNGPNKGGAAMALQVFKASPGMKHVWQVHRAMAAGTANTEDEFIANPGGADQAHWLRADGRGRWAVHHHQRPHHDVPHLSVALSACLRGGQ